MAATKAILSYLFYLKFSDLHKNGQGSAAMSSHVICLAFNCSSWRQNDMGFLLSSNLFQS